MSDTTPYLTPDETLYVTSNTTPRPTKTNTEDFVN